MKTLQTALQIRDEYRWKLHDVVNQYCQSRDRYPHVELPHMRETIARLAMCSEIWKAIHNGLNGEMQS